MLEQRGWTPVEVDPGNCVRSSWRKTVGAYTAEIKLYDGEVKGFITAAHQKVQGTLTLNGCECLVTTADKLDRLLQTMASETSIALPMPARRPSDLSAVPA